MKNGSGYRREGGVLPPLRDRPKFHQQGSWVGGGAQTAFWYLSVSQNAKSKSVKNFWHTVSNSRGWSLSFI